MPNSIRSVAAVGSPVCGIGKSHSTNSSRPREIFESRNLSKSAMDVRDSILRALLAECRTGPDPELAHSFLIALYDPLLRRTSAQLQRTSWGRALEPDDIEAETVARFVELLATMNLETNRDIHTSLVRRLPGQIVDWAENQFLERHHLSERDSDENIGDSTVWFATALPRRRRDGWELDLVELVLAELQARGGHRRRDEATARRQGHPSAIPHSAERARELQR